MAGMRQVRLFPSEVYITWLEIPEVVLKNQSSGLLGKRLPNVCI